jgi:hypothetical protein
MIVGRQIRRDLIMAKDFNQIDFKGRNEGENGKAS